MNEETIDAEEEELWEEEAGWDTETEKRAPWKKPYKYAETDAERQAEREAEKASEDIQVQWQEIIAELQKIKDPILIAELAKTLLSVLKTQTARKPIKYPYEEKPVHKMTASELVYKGLSKLSLEELMQCRGLPPELLTQRIIKSYDYNPIALEMLEYVKRGEQIPGSLLRKADARDLSALEKLIKEASPPRRIMKSEAFGKPMTWEEAHELASKLGAPGRRKREH